jgi:hypothetical protein
VFISEIGIIMNGMSILFDQYDTKKNVLTQNADLRNSLLDAILKMSAAIYNEDIHHFNFKKYKLIINSRSLKAEKTTKIIRLGQVTDLVIYCIADPDINIQLAQKLLSEIYSEFLKKFPDIAENPSTDMNRYKPFIPIFDKILSDLKKSPEDRFGGIF